jgi:hypothetical protein
MVGWAMGAAAASVEGWGWSRFRIAGHLSPDQEIDPGSHTARDDTDSIISARNVGGISTLLLYFDFGV